jgi:hypothetical protein
MWRILSILCVKSYHSIHNLHWTNQSSMQIGFLTEWQMYAQKLEGDSWIGEKMDTAKIDKMSGLFSLRI